MKTILDQRREKENEENKKELQVALRYFDVIERAKSLKKELDSARNIYNAHLSKHSDDYEVDYEKRKIESKIEYLTALLETPYTNNDDDVHLVEWMFNKGKLRTQEEIEQLEDDRKYFDVYCKTDYEERVWDIDNRMCFVGEWWWVTGTVFNLLFTLIILMALPEESISTEAGNFIIILTPLPLALLQMLFISKVIRPAVLKIVDGVYGVPTQPVEKISSYGYLADMAKGYIISKMIRSMTRR